MSTIPLLIGMLILLGLWIWLWLRLQSFERQFGSFFKSTDKASVMQALNQFATLVNSHSDKLEELDHKAQQLKLIAERAHTRVGFVRFNPFSDSGGDQSFCLAVLDTHGTGWVISSIHARTGNRVYAKQLIDGKSSHNLSEEEATAITKALKLNPYHGPK